MRIMTKFFHRYHIDCCITFYLFAGDLYFQAHYLDLFLFNLVVTSKYVNQRYAVVAFGVYCNLCVCLAVTCEFNMTFTYNLCMQPPLDADDFEDPSDQVSNLLWHWFYVG